MRISHPLHLLLFIVLLLSAGQPGQCQKKGRAERLAISKLNSWVTPVPEWVFPDDLKIDSVKIDEAGRVVNIYFPPEMLYNPVREESLVLLQNSVKSALGKKFTLYSINMYSGSFTLESLIPNYFRNILPVDEERLPRERSVAHGFISRPGVVPPRKGLDGRLIALWHSHGYYFDMNLDRWEWQRAKLFGSVEDISVMAYVLPYLAPMLENSGATVFLPRERDIQVNEVIVDSDRSTGSSRFELTGDATAVSAGKGFLMRDTLFTGDNPFVMGTSLKITGGSALFVPEIPESGRYGVTIAYPHVKGYSGKVAVRVIHTGGDTEFIVDQSLGGGTWIWLGSFLFEKGMNAGRGAVMITGQDGSSALVDAVRFGGGMGNVARRPAEGFTSNQWSLNAGSGQDTTRATPVIIKHNWKLSGKPRFLEGARYWLQYAGFPDTLVYTPNKGKNDYNDDYMSRSEWVNFLVRKPDTSGMQGMDIPIDLSLAFHTDAGITPDDSVIGTLGIYSTITGGGMFPDGSSRLASRDLTDIIQTQVTEDIKVLFNPGWTRRAMWDKSYYEARKPDVPAMLLELLSHQNLADQRYGFDPRFRFHVSRAVYKGMLRYLADVSGMEYVVHPLPVSHFSIEPVDGRKIRLRWQPVADPLESTAVPTSYRVYLRRGDNGFDNGTTVQGTEYLTEVPEYNTLFSFRVTAVNEGGESFPSEELSVGINPDADGTILIVNGFDRISGPAWFDRGGIAGVAWWDDRGVAFRYNFSSTGDQYDFDRISPWTDDDNAGWGASWSDDEGRVIPGNTFDFTRVHGRSVLAAGKSFFSVSDEVFTTGDYDLDRWFAIDFLFGEEKSTPSAFDPRKWEFSIYTPEFLESLSRLKEAKKPVFMSGAYVGTDLVMASDTATTALVQRFLHFKPRTGHAVRTGEVRATDIAAPYFTGSLGFNTGSTDDFYAAESPDAIEPADKQSVTAFRYSENNTSAAVMHSGEVRAFVMGYPFETILSQEERDTLMKEILDFLLKK